MITIASFVAVLAMSDVRAGHHDISASANDVVVSTTWVLGALPEPDALFELAAALPRETAIEGAQPEFGADGRIVALRLAAPCSRCVLRSTTPWSSAKQAGALPVPVAKGNGVHRIALDPDVAFRPDAELGLVTELGFTAPAGFGFGERNRVDGLLVVDAPHLGAYYVRADDIAEAGGLVGDMERRADVQRRVAWAAGVVFVLVCGATAFEYRRARKRAELERAEALIEAEYAELEDKAT
jgi:hypothetical protein